MLMWLGGVLFLMLVVKPRWYEALACAAAALGIAYGLRPNLFTAKLLTGQLTLNHNFPVIEMANQLLSWLTAALLTLGLLNRILRRGRMLPPIVLVPAVAQFVWFVPGGSSLAFVEFVPFFHCLQYLLIAWSMQLKEKLDLQGAQAHEAVRETPIRREVPIQVGAAVLLLGLAFLASQGGVSVQIALGFLLLVGLGVAWLRGWYLAVGGTLAVILPFLLGQSPIKDEVRNWEYVLSMTVPAALLLAWAMQKREAADDELVRPSGLYVLWESMRWGLVNYAGGVMLFFILPSLVARSFNLNPTFAMGVTIAVVQIHHFFVDGVIWKLKRKTVSSPLMVNLGDLLGTSRPAAAPA